MPSIFRAAFAAVAVAIVFCTIPFEAAYARPGVDEVKCATGSLDHGDGTKNLVIDRPCEVGAGEYLYRDVNVVKGGKLSFVDVVTDFWATSILIENEGVLVAGEKTPIGTLSGKLTIHLYGSDQGMSGGKGITCWSGATCGVPENVWNTGNTTEFQMPGEFAPLIALTPPSGVPLPVPGKDYFYSYSALPVDDGEKEGYFGYKVLGVSYGGTLKLFGKKGATYGTVADSSSGTSWVRLDQSVKPEDCVAPVPCKLQLDRAVDWAKDDEIVLTTTDYLPGHSERLTITAVEDVVDPSGPAGSKKTIVTVAEKFKYRHNGAKFNMSIVPQRLGLGKDSVETRAAVALLTRSIRIVSAGDNIKSEFPPAPTWSPTSLPGYFFGGHTIIRQGAKQVQIQGVEFKQLGQGGRIGHYPVHFHAARLTPDDTFIKDSSVDESMTRWFVIHATQNVTLARNVGYESIGHGYYLEEGTEINNRLVSNIGILARAAVNDEQNPRQVPGILAAKTANNLSSDNPAAYKTELVPFYSDYDHPAVFWIMNGWNDFEYNMAVGAGACGVCYWLLPGANSGHSRHLSWTGYASMQADPTGVNPTERAGLTPLKNFIGNYCSTASMSFNTVANTTACIGIGASDVPNADTPLIKSIVNPLAPDACDQSNPHKKNPPDQLEPYACGFPSDAHTAANNYYPQIGGGGRFPTKCVDQNSDCSKVPQCSPGNLDNCMVTVIDNYTSSFHWAEQNFAAIWLRPQWYLLQNSVLTDVINGGLTFVTGGGYTASDAIPGHWALAFRNAFIGETQPGNAYTSIGSPFNPAGLACDQPASANHCLSAKEGVSFPKGNFGVNARLFNIYDGPAYQDSNAYMNIKSLTLDCTPGSKTYSLSNCGSSKYLQGPSTGVPRDGNRCYLPNAAIGWKQPNGFYYPPAFHSDNLFFSDVEIRHYVTQPLFKPGTYQTDVPAAWGKYCNWQTDMFNNWTDIDRQTELNDDDGSLTGYVHTISVNEDPFFKAPRDAIECASDKTVGTSPYDYVTAVVYPACLTDGNACPEFHPAYISDPAALASSWNKDCGGPFCYGVPLYRQLVTASEFKTPPANAPYTFMAGQGTGQRSTLAVNNGVFYIDTTVGAATQSALKPPVTPEIPPVTPGDPPVPQIPSPVQKTSYNVFQPGGTYYTFLVFAKPSTTQTYQMYVGTKDFNKLTDVWPVRVDIKPNPPVYTPAKLPSGQTLPPGWDVKYNENTGILQVTMSMKFDDFATNWQATRVNSCKPATFCAMGTGASPICGCAKGNDGKPLDPLCQDSVCAWAGNDPDCPEGGCWGFGFKLPNTFATDVSPNPRPASACFSRSDPAWNPPKRAVVPSPPPTGMWTQAEEPVAGKAPVCYQAPVNSDDFCD